MSGPLLVIEDVSMVFSKRAGLVRSRDSAVHALNGVSLTVSQGECVGVVGESGSGKSTLGLVTVGLIAPTRGQVSLDGRVLPTRASARSAQSRRDLQIVLQDPYDSLDPAMTVAATVAEGLDIHGIGPWAGRRDRAARMLLEVGLDGAFLDRWPHELSGGQRQRVAIARALAVEPRVLVLDEPTSALDLSVQAQILNLLLQIQERRGIACLLISHDIDVIRHLCHRVYVMQAGRVVEEGPASMVLTTPCEPYTRRLIDSVPRLPAALGDAAWTGRATC